MRIAGRRKPLILVTNDDGIDAPGIFALASALQLLGTVQIIAPRHEQSAVGHAITIRGLIRTMKYSLGGALSSVPATAIEGTPADCTKLALNELLHRRPDLVVSGINNGSNLAVNVMYSGTVSAATESSIRGVDSIAVSLVEGARRDYDAAAQCALAIARKVLRSRLPRGIVLNVNVPPIPYEEIKGLRVTRLATSRWEENFVEASSGDDHTYFAYKGEFVNLDDNPDTDISAVGQGYVSICPLQHDLTSHGCVDVLSTWRWGEFLL